MKTTLAAAIAALALPAAAHAADPPGKTVFLAQKCDQCHSVQSEGIAVSRESGGDEEVTLRVIDLSGAGLDGDAAFLKAYLLKDQAGADGKKHPKKFKGTDPDLAALAGWLAERKTPAK